MALSIYSHALCSLDNVKSRLTISVASFDTLLTLMINRATDVIENYCERRFKEDTYANEIHDGGNGSNQLIHLNNFPVSSVSAAQYDNGLPNSPSWVSFLSSDWRLLIDKKLNNLTDVSTFGRIEIPGGAPAGRCNLRFSYVAGYKISWSSEGTLASHNLPGDIADVCERLVVRMFKKREAEGIDETVTNNITIRWAAQFLSDDDKEILNGHKRFECV